MPKSLTGVALAAALALTGAVAAPAANAAPDEARGCTWYIYKTNRNTTYYEYATGNEVNHGFWKHPDKGSLIKTNVPFNGKNRTLIKFEHFTGSWRNLSDGRYPYINRAAVDYLRCY